jgi:hypothetical protein
MTNNVFDRDYKAAQLSRLQDALHEERLNQLRNQDRAGVLFIVLACACLWGLFFYIGLHV